MKCKCNAEMSLIHDDNWGTYYCKQCGRLSVSTEDADNILFEPIYLSEKNIEQKREDMKDLVKNIIFYSQFIENTAAKDVLLKKALYLKDRYSIEV